MVVIRWMILSLFFMSFLDVYAEGDWKLRKDKDGIKVYTQQREKGHIYKYKVVTFLDASSEKVFDQVVDFRENLQYMELVDSLSFLEHIKDQRYINYMRFHMPWPVTNREMVMEMRVTKNKGMIYLNSNDLPDYLPWNDGLVRIHDFHEEWIIQEVQKGRTRIEVQGWVDPGGSIPSWVVNLFSVRTPYNFISGIRDEVYK